MPATRTHPPALARTPRSYDPDFGRLFGDLAAELARAVDPAAVTAAVESLTTVALSLGTPDWWAQPDSKAGWELVGKPGRLEWDEATGH